MTLDIFGVLWYNYFRIVERSTMASKLLTIAASPRQIFTAKPIAALQLYMGGRWDVLREILPRIVYRPRVVVISPKYGFFFANVAILPYEKTWTVKSWKPELPTIQAQYNAILRPLIDSGTDVMLCATTVQQAAVLACGLQQDIVTRNASLYTYSTLPGIETEALRRWLTKEAPNGNR